MSPNQSTIRGVFLMRNVSGSRKPKRLGQEGGTAQMYKTNFPSVCHIFTNNSVAGFFPHSSFYSVYSLFCLSSKFETCNPPPRSGPPVRCLRTQRGGPQRCHRWRFSTGESTPSAATCPRPPPTTSGNATTPSILTSLTSILSGQKHLMDDLRGCRRGHRIMVSIKVGSRVSGSPSSHSQPPSQLQGQWERLLSVKGRNQRFAGVKRSRVGCLLRENK